MAASIKVGFTIGDINGVGPELIIRNLSDNRILSNITPVIYGSEMVFNKYKEQLGISAPAFFSIQDASKCNPKKINLVEALADDVKMDIGKSTYHGGKAAFASLKKATDDLAAGKIDVLVTAPINKDNIQSEEFDFPGHTEFLAKLANVENALMFMCSDGLRVGVVTGHIPLKDVATTISQENIGRKLEQMNKSLKEDFAITRPRIAVLGLNPHAGEKGMLGKEEEEIISPAIEKAFNNGIMAFGPFPADGFFGSSSFRNYDAILAMYHDQGLIPFKAMTFGAGVNYTAGLPIIRTSPDHGTAYDIAGKGEAMVSSFRNAIYLAKDIFLNRKLSDEINKNPLKKHVSDRNEQRNPKNKKDPIKE